MGSLYIGGAQCKWADIADNWEEFDAKKKEIALLAEKFDVSISRAS